MKSRRKIWSIPVALAVVLMFAALIGVSSFVAAQQSDDAPKVATPLADVITAKVLEISGGTPLTDNDAELPQSATADLAAVFNDKAMNAEIPPEEVDEQLAYTIMTGAPNTASITLSTGDDYSDEGAPDGGVVANWWNDLTQTERKTAVGAKIIDNTLPADDDGRGLCDSGDFCGDYDHDGDNDDTDLRTIIGVYGPDLTDDDGNAYPELADPAKVIVTQAFHWDMLSGDEMVAAARAGGLSGATGYEKRFAGLDHRPDVDTTGNDEDDQSQRDRVQTLYDTITDDTDTDDVDEARGPVLVRGQGTITDGEQTAALTVTSGDAIADIGTATITVKASDAYGRLIPPPDGSKTVGSSVDIKVQGKELQELGIPEEGSSGTFEGDNTAGTPNIVEPDTFVFIIEGTSKMAGTIQVVSNDTAGSTEHESAMDGNAAATPAVATTYDAIRGRLQDGTNFPFRVNQEGVRGENQDVFTITVADGSTLDLADSPYEFTFEAYALSSITNVTSINVKVELAVGNQPPAFVSGLPTEADVSESMKVGDVIATFSAIDPDHTTGISYRLSPSGTPFEIDDTGKLKVAEILDYQGDEEAIGDDPEADEYIPAEDAGTDNEKNIYELTITATDGETPITHTFTVTITDSPDVPASGSRSFTINENTPNTVEGTGGDEVKYLKDSEDAKATVQLLDSDGVPVPAGFRYEIDENNSPEIEVALFRINDDGSLYLKDGQSLNFESATGARYLLSVKATGEVDGATTVYTGAVIITVANVAEAPEFDADAPTSLRVDETANIGDAVNDTNDTDVLTDDVPAVVTATDDDEGQTPGYSLLNSDGTAYTDGMFAIGANGAITVAGELDAEVADSTVALQVQASDVNGLPSTHDITIEIGDANEAPNFLTPAGGSAAVDIPESQTYADGAVVGFTAIDPDGNDLTFTIREGSAAALFEISGVDKDDATGVWAGELRVNQTATLDYDTDAYNKETGYRVHIEVQDNPGLNDTLAVDVKLLNVNDNKPVFAANALPRVSVAENTVRDTVIGNYPAIDADGDAVTYSLSGTNDKSFAITDTGDLMTLESLDYDSNTPCAAAGCSINVVASDGKAGSDDATLPVTITVSPVEDSVSTLNVTKANPVPGTTRGNPMSALSNTKDDEEFGSA